MFLYTLALFFYSVISSLANPVRDPSPRAIDFRADANSSLGGYKAGLGWTDTSVDLSQFRSKVSWYYNWSPSASYESSSMQGLEYVPMFWGNKSIPQFGEVTDLVKSGKVTSVLGMNELSWFIFCVENEIHCINKILYLLLLLLQTNNRRSINAYSHRSSLPLANIYPATKVPQLEFWRKRFCAIGKSGHGEWTSWYTVDAAVLGQLHRMRNRFLSFA